MIEAAESSVQIVLSIKEGKGFEQVLQPTLLLGTLNGHSLQTDRIDANPTPQYETDLVWETNKTTLRKMRSGQVPLKLECFAFKENGGKERLGYVLLSIRSAHVTSKHGDSSPRASWHKLLGLRNDFKTQKPQLLLTLKIEDRKNMDSNPTAERRPEIEYHRNPAGDFERFSSRNISSEAKCETQQIADRQCPKYQSDKITHSYPCDAIFCNCVNRNYPKGVTSYHCFCLNISLAAITLVSDRLSGRQIEFRFHHPKAEITSTTRVTMPVSSERAKLHDIGCQFHFISAPDEIKQLLQSFPPKISMHDTNENAKSLSLLMLDMKPLFYQDKPECQYKLPMYDTDGNKIGEIDVILKLENHGPHFVLKKEITGKNLGPPILDDSLAYKIVDELETWKDRQKEIFKVELKKKEERYLNMLSEEWRKQKENLESKLACSVEQCKMLANSLNNATEDLRTRRLKSLENESRLIKANEDVQWRYEVKLQELKDSLHAMQSELTSKVTKLEEKKAALETQMELLLYENENLKMSMNKQTQELQMYQKASLTQDQTASLLQEIKVLEEKLDNAQKGKSFFKERWGKAVREIHRMKLDNQCAMQVQIKNSKEELKNVDLAEMLSMDTKALNNDQMLLHELQKEIDIIKPSASKETYNEIFMPSERYNERLQALKEERDSLLRTGSYAADDVVIKRLNTEIQSLLISR
ncbi:centrosomal protein of 120 kDa isoform X2 [Ooceraea biroi]|uniref:centrosomal protein of 120 kDa isoform X2 n=1 Tax=Ooceraea biroi TaxID=2015173 RepID=UPI000F07E078|nr:centrosomal protein of 120 kDa isoform X2 [Ooceraea biroi]